MLSLNSYQICQNYKLIFLMKCSEAKMVELNIVKEPYWSWCDSLNQTLDSDKRFKHFPRDYKEIYKYSKNIDWIILNISFISFSLTLIGQKCKNFTINLYIYINIYIWISFNLKFTLRGVHRIVARWRFIGTIWVPPGPQSPPPVGPLTLSWLTIFWYQKKQGGY